MIQLACLYGPLVGAGLLAFRMRPCKRLATGILFALAWNAALLPWVDSFARLAGLWTYQTSSATLAGMPLALYFGWIIAWGICAPLLAHALGGRLWLVAVLMVALDLRVMPEMEPVLVLHDHWWWGELMVAMLLLLPSLFIARWTASGERIGLRCVMLVPSFGGIFLGLPLLVECGGYSGVMERWASLSPHARVLFSFAGAVFSVPGLAAVRDLALTGGGTPVPLDPPLRLVTHGAYAHVRNPMQLSMTSLLLLESLFLMSPWPAVLAALGVVYSEGIARWSENRDMEERFGPAWSSYHQRVRPWVPRWHPQIGEPCELWLDGGCGMCSEVARWFLRRNPRQLVIRDAREWPGDALHRVTWIHPASGRRECGVAAMAMALQHLNFCWAVVGWFAGLPLVSHTLQICMDAAGAGRRTKDAD